ncbi:sensor histidine kinase WalK [Abditibacteriota bacterium]|nr:sensor histidine kinase WalK [Abditibacteriota bacterium]
MPRSLSQGPRQSRVTWGMAQGLVIALGLLLVLRPGVLGGLANSLEWDTLDWWFFLRNPVPVRSVAILAVDEETVMRWKGRAFDAHDVAVAVRALKNHGASAVALDFPSLCQMPLGAAEQAELADAMRFNGAVTLPLELRVGLNAPATSLDPALDRFAFKPEERVGASALPLANAQAIAAPPDALLAAAAGAGHLSFDFDRFGRARLLPLDARLGDRLFPPLALATASAAGVLPPPSSDGPLLLNFSRGIGGDENEAFEVVSLAQALRDPARFSAFKGRVALMGVTSRSMTSRYPTPSGFRIPECTLTAVALDNLLTDRPLRRAPLLWHWFLTVLTALVVGGLSASWRPAWSAALALLCVSVVALISVGMFGRDVWLDASVPWLAIGMTALVGVVGRARRQERDAISISSTVDALTEVADLVAVGRNQSELLERVLVFAAKTLGATGASALLLEEEGTHLKFVAAIGPRSEPLVGQRVNVSEGIVGQVAREGEALIANDAREHGHSGRFDLLTGLETRSILAVPLRVRGAVVGALEVINREGETPFSEADLELLQAIANQAAVALDNVRLYDRLAFRVEESQDALAIANRELQADKTLMQTVLYSMTDGLVVTDEVGRVQLVNAAAARLLPELGREQVIGTPLGFILPDFPLGAISSLSSNDRDEDHDEAVLLFRGSIDAPIAVEGHIALLRGNEGGLAGLVAVFADVTQRRRIEQAKSDFVSFVAHEMRSPLTSISGFSTMLSRDESGGHSSLPPATRTRFLGLIRGESERLTRLINTLLDAARLEAGGAIELNRDTLELPPLIDLSLETQRAYSSRHTLKAEITHPLPPVFADADKVQQILINLLSNAQKYSPGGEIVLGARARAGFVELWVRDQGPGIAPEQRQILFSRFGRAPQSAQGIGAGAKPTGTGLGLFLTKYLIESHGGKIWVESEPGHGATFRFTLPVEAKTE